MAIRITFWIQGLFSAFVAIGRYAKWLTDINLLLRTDSPDGGTDIATLVSGKTCLGGGVHCPSASSFIFRLPLLCSLRKRKGNEEYLYSAILHQGTHKALRHGSHSFTCKQHHACLSFVSVHQMSPPQQLRQRTSNCSALLIYRPRKDERLSWPSTGW